MSAWAGCNAGYLDSSNNIIHEPGLEHKENLESTQAKNF